MVCLLPHWSRQRHLFYWFTDLARKIFCLIVDGFSHGWFFYLFTGLARDGSSSGLLVYPGILCLVTDGFSHGWFFYLFTGLARDWFVYWSARDGLSILAPWSCRDWFVYCLARDGLSTSSLALPGTGLFTVLPGMVCLLAHWSRQRHLGYWFTGLVSLPSSRRF